MPAILALLKSRLMLVTTAVVLCAMAACGGPRHDIVGKWLMAGDSGGMVWDFGKDGFVLMGSTRGRYSFGDRDRVKIETRSGTSIYYLEFLGDRMSLKDPYGSKIEFTRSK